MEELTSIKDMKDWFVNIEQRINSLMFLADNCCREINVISQIERSFIDSNLIESSMEQRISQIDKMMGGFKDCSDLASAASAAIKISDYSMAFPDLASAAIVGTRIADQLNFGSSLASATSIGIPKPDYSMAFPDLASVAAVAGTRIADQLNFGSSLASATSIGIPKPDYSMAFSDLASAAVAGTRIADQLNFGSCLASVTSIGIPKPDYSMAFSDLASAAVAGTKIADQLNFGSSLASAISIGIPKPDYSMAFPDLASAAIVGTKIADQLIFNSIRADAASAAIKIPNCPEVCPIARIAPDDMQNPEVHEVGSDKDIESHHVLPQVNPTFSILNKKRLKQFLKNNDEALAREESYNMLKLRNLCNDAANLAIGREIFKSTTKASDAQLDICYLIPNDKASFGDFIDNLYILFYEGAGNDNLRFLKEKGGVLEENECKFIWCVKHLRNNWLRHDPDHGSEKKIRASKDTLRSAFRGLGLNRYPTEPEDFFSLHSKLIKESRKFLEAILERINNYDAEKIGE